MADPRADILSRILADKRAARALRHTPLPALRRQAEAAPAPPEALLSLRRGAGPIRAIAEIKRRSPSAGWLRPDADAAAVARAYAQAGAAAISVLTDGPCFGGAPADLRAAARAVPVPLLRKDFLLDEHDLCEARLWGASCALLIARVFPDDGELAGLIAAAEALGLHALVEAHSQAEALRALRAGARIIGVNHRDLATLRIDLDLSLGLRAALGEGPVLVAESGLRGAAEVRAMADRGMDAVLVGEALMRQADPGAALAALLGGAVQGDGGPPAKEAGR